MRFKRERERERGSKPSQQATDFIATLVLKSVSYHQSLELARRRSPHSLGPASRNSNGSTALRRLLDQLDHGLRLRDVDRVTRALGLYDRSARTLRHAV